MDINRLNKLIDSISIVKGNLSYIEKTGKINGTLRDEITRVMLEFAISERQSSQEVKQDADAKALHIVAVSSRAPQKGKRGRPLDQQTGHFDGVADDY